MPSVSVLVTTDRRQGPRLLVSLDPSTPPPPQRLRGPLLLVDFSVVSLMDNAALIVGVAEWSCQYLAVQ